MQSGDLNVRPGSSGDHGAYAVIAAGQIILVPPVIAA